MPAGAGGGKAPGGQRWHTCIRHHTHLMVACDCCVAGTVRVRGLDMVVGRAGGSRRVVHGNVTAHSTEAWAGQQVRAVRAEPHPARYVLHDRDGIDSRWLDTTVTAMGWVG